MSCRACGNGIVQNIDGRMVIAPDTDRLCPTHASMWREVNDARRSFAALDTDLALDQMMDAQVAFWDSWGAA